MDKSPLAPARFPDLKAIPGVQVASIASGIKYSNRDDLMLARFDAHTTVAGVFTQSSTAGAPVLACREKLKGHEACALIVNAGNSNAFTGKVGEQHCQEICSEVASVLDCNADTVFIASTGVIGEVLPVERIINNVPDLARKLGDDSWQQAARAITTTDTFPKGAVVETRIGGRAVTINGIAKGSGMIAPDMATMLAFVFTDAMIPPSILQVLLEEANQRSFNCITVDSDTSTSDTCLLFATGKAGNTCPGSIDDPELLEFRNGLHQVMLDLAQQVVRDGEGATKFIEVKVTGARNDGAAKVIAKSIANSPLVKTAIAGEDANWGRIVMAVGKSGEEADRDKLQITIGGVRITENGQVVEHYDESQVAEHLKQKEISIGADVGIADGTATVWTCDLTHGYISINADYRS
jgi:glutamate N-acetyltransferase/amino-acid N-acetyltransferase